MSSPVHEAPVWVIPVLRNAADSTLHVIREAELGALLGLPDDALSMALVPLGYPARGRWAQPKRQPLEQVVYRNRWGATREKADPDPA